MVFAAVFALTGCKGDKQSSQAAQQPVQPAEKKATEAELALQKAELDIAKAKVAEAKAKAATAEAKAAEAKAKAAAAEAKTNAASPKIAAIPSNSPVADNTAQQAAATGTGSNNPFNWSIQSDPNNPKKALVPPVLQPVNGRIPGSKITIASECNSSADCKQMCFQGRCVDRKKIVCPAYAQCPPTYWRMFWYLDKLCQNTFTPKMWNYLEKGRYDGEHEARDLVYLWNLPGTTTSYLFKSAKYLNAFFYHPRRAEWLPGPCLDVVGQLKSKAQISASTRSYVKKIRRLWKATKSIAKGGQKTTGNRVKYQACRKACMKSTNDGSWCHSVCQGLLKRACTNGDEQSISTVSFVCVNGVWLQE